ncbi:hypothetical protein CBER1_11960 [Cercospora berteroae]|uniref:Uncharacterized protein n=1 Tax=Cercospora berteroae TaxID=357750 RepID=A0A2S6CMI0_9PEZI|nr:hypothetical protein CBER1_11960 [Cercospora berteroae]
MQQAANGEPTNALETADAALSFADAMRQLHQEDTKQQAYSLGGAGSDGGKVAAQPAEKVGTSPSAEDGKVCAEEQPEGCAGSDTLDDDGTAVTLEIGRGYDTHEQNRQNSDLDQLNLSGWTHDDSFSLTNESADLCEDLDSEPANDTMGKLTFESFDSVNDTQQSADILNGLDESAGIHPWSPPRSRGADAAARARHLPRTTVDKELDNFHLPLPSAQLGVPSLESPHSSSVFISTSDPHDMWHCKGHQSPAPVLSESRDAGAITLFKRKHLDSKSRNAARPLSELAREVLSVFAAERTVKESEDSLEDSAFASSAIVIYDIARSGTPHSDFLTLIPPSVDNADLSAVTPSSRSWALALVDFDESSSATVQICSAAASLSTETHSRLRDVLISAAPEQVATAMRSVPLEKYTASPLPDVLDRHADDPEDFVKCIALAICFLTGVNAPRSIFLRVWIGAVSAITFVSSGFLDYCPTIELPEVPAVKMEVKVAQGQTLQSISDSLFSIFTAQAQFLRAQVRALSDLKNHLQLVLQCVASCMSATDSLSIMQKLDEKLTGQLNYVGAAVDEIGTGGETDRLCEGMPNEFRSGIATFRRCMENSRSLHKLDMWASMSPEKADSELQAVTMRYCAMRKEFEEILKEGLKLVGEEQ